MGEKSKRKVLSEDIEYEVSSGNLFKDFGYSNPEEAKAKWDLAFLIKSIIKASIHIDKKNSHRRVSI